MPSSHISAIANALHRFVVGRDGEGHWIARDEEGVTGGVFADRSSAVRWKAAIGRARSASRQQPCAFHCSTDPIASVSAFFGTV